MSYNSTPIVLYGIEISLIDFYSYVKNVSDVKSSYKWVSEEGIQTEQEDILEEVFFGEIGPYETFDEFKRELEIVSHVYCCGDRDSRRLWIGEDYKCMREDETKSQFQKTIEDLILKIFGEEYKCSKIEECIEV